MSDFGVLMSDVWHMLSHMSIWVKIGFLGQAVFTARFVVQWVASEKKRDSVMPVAFWWLSLSGGLILLSYAIHRKDPVIILGQAMGLVVYVRNLMLVAKAQRRGTRRTKKAPATTTAAVAATPKPHRFDTPAAKEVPWA
ncbi:lipid-A-disaccharide synthase N-terminal domain-containing protein [Singulisphaera sp. PoT]|uniref:lipid-A-disaccharide synthase N-terminal domain-containing protein n=1 Tax=Singulisphaera sp. PoT TaxID=3411797 RepID=UPI003BF46C13